MGRSRSRSRSRRRNKKSSKSKEISNKYRSRDNEDRQRRKSNFSSTPPLEYLHALQAVAAERGSLPLPSSMMNPIHPGARVVEKPTAASMSFQRREEKPTAASTSFQKHGKHDAWGQRPDHGQDVAEDKNGNGPLYKANFGLSGALNKDEKTGNVYRGVPLKFSEPEDARGPTRRWRLYVFKGEEILDTLYLHRQSAYLIGRERKICDIPVDHASCSKQHAVIQYRLTGEGEEKSVKPYLMDLQSTNGTFINGERVEDSRYYELKEKDIVKFGESTREYVLLNDESNG